MVEYVTFRWNLEQDGRIDFETMRCGKIHQNIGGLKVSLFVSGRAYRPSKTLYLNIEGQSRRPVGFWKSDYKGRGGEGLVL